MLGLFDCVLVYFHGAIQKEWIPIPLEGLEGVDAYQPID